MELVSSSLINSIGIGLLSVIIFLFLFLRYHFRPSNSKEPPLAVGAWPILGHLIPLFAANTQTPPRTLGSLADRYGPLYTIKLGTIRAVVLSNWEMAKECFTTNDIVVSTRPKLVATQHMGYNGAMFALALYGPYWRQLRKIVTLGILTNRRVEQLGHVRLSEVQTSIKELYRVWCSQKNEESGYVLVELKQWFTEVTFNLVLRITVGKRYFGGAGVVDEREAQRCITALGEFMRLMGVVTVGDAVPWLGWFDFGGHVKEMKETALKLDRVLGEWLEEHHQKKKKKVDCDDDQDFMDVMISLLDGTIIDGFAGDTIIKATVLTIFLGGAETTTVTLTWAICLLLRNPVMLKKAKEEVNIQIGKEKCITESDISKLVYLQAIVKETLRLYPAAPLSGPHEFSESCTLGGYHIKKGTRLITNLWKINTDPSVWSDPLEFKPERFLTTHKDVDVRGHHFELLPFGCGRRICPGISFGLQMVHLTLATFLHSFEILNPSDELVDMTESFGLTNTKATPLEVLVKPSLSTNCYEIM
ncbi:cytochrome P450 82A4-like [Lotus japonicus]|uniref:cytochrome P450 82A4-like n=1 Tax=Lotus japonicus TaxID=34305 RepID=UPI002587BE49|nr:cytochrome P450 82A4-like [Lotus japonicus]